jgi:hypothetical protein
LLPKPELLRRREVMLRADCVEEVRLRIEVDRAAGLRE